MTRLFALTLSLAALGVSLAAIVASAQGSAQGSLPPEKEAIEPSSGETSGEARVPAVLPVEDIEEALAEILARVQWPLDAEKDLILLTRPQDLDPQDRELIGHKLILGPWLWHRSFEFPLPMQLPAKLRSPFRGANLDAEGRGSMELGKGRLRFDFRLSRSQKARPLWKGQAAAAVPALELHLGSLGRLLPDAALRRNFIQDLLLPAFRKASAAKAPDPGPGQRGREGMIMPGSKPPPARRAFHSRELRNLPLLGFLKEDELGRLAPSLLQASSFTLQASGVAAAGLEAERTIHRALLSDFLSDLRWPLPDPAEGKRARRLLADDSWNRAGLENHAALDLGSLSPIDGHERQWPAGTPVAAPVAAPVFGPVSAPVSASGRGLEPHALPRRDGRAWIYERRRGRYRLRLLIALYHLRAEKNSKTNSEALVLAAAPSGGFERSDPWAILQGQHKGPHCHLEILGLYGGQPGHEAFFVRYSVRRALLDAPSTFQKTYAPQILAKPEPDRLSQALTGLAGSLPSLPGLVQVKRLDPARSGSGYAGHRIGDHIAWELRLSRSIRLGAPWTLTRDRASWQIQHRGQELGWLRIAGGSLRQGRLGPGRFRAEFRFEGPQGLSFIQGLQAPLRHRLLGELLPALLLRRGRKPTK